MGFWNFLKRVVKRETHEETLKRMEKDRERGKHEEVDQIIKTERTTSRALRNFDRQFEKLEGITEEMQEAISEHNTTIFKKKFRVRHGKIYKLEGYKVKAVAYAAIITKVLKESMKETKIAKEKTQLRTFSNNILKKLELLENRVSKIVNAVRLINDQTEPSDELWVKLEVAVRDASQAITQIKNWAEGGLALEKQIRERMKEA